MLELRSAGGISSLANDERHYDTLYIDHNMVNISNLTNVFPDVVDYLGLEIPYQSIIKPIPRALWPGKPEGLSTSIEAALGSFDGVTTLACTFAGEAYMAFGLVGVLIAGLFFGAAAGWWNQVGQRQEFFLLSDIVRIRFPVRGHVDAQSADDGPIHAANAGDVGDW